MKKIIMASVVALLIGCVDMPEKQVDTYELKPVNSIFDSAKIVADYHGEFSIKYESQPKKLISKSCVRKNYLEMGIADPSGDGGFNISADYENVAVLNANLTSKTSIVEVTYFINGKYRKPSDQAISDMISVLYSCSPSLNT